MKLFMLYVYLLCAIMKMLEWIGVIVAKIRGYDMDGYHYNWRLNMWVKGEKDSNG
jgi:hypothetical protein